ncbi:MAG: hypothetical protein R2862_11330 [Thermoanaerobaculia bacterium]
MRDAAGIPSTFLLRQLVPGWVVPIARAVVQQPLSAGVLDFPRTGAEAADGRRWRLSAGKGLELGAPRPVACRTRSLRRLAGDGRLLPRAPPRLLGRGNSLRRLERGRRPPGRADAGRAPAHRRLETLLSFARRAARSDLHSAFLVPEVRLAFVFGRERELAAPSPVAAAS